WAPPGTRPLSRRWAGGCAGWASTGARTWTLRGTATGWWARSPPGSPATWCTWTSRRSAASPTVAAGAHGHGSAQHKKSRAAKKAGARAGYVYLHSIIDGYSRLAYTEALPNETAAATIGF